MPLRAALALCAAAPYGRLVWVWCARAPGPFSTELPPSLCFAGVFPRCSPSHCAPCLRHVCQAHVACNTWHPCAHTAPHACTHLPALTHAFGLAPSFSHTRPCSLSLPHASHTVHPLYAELHIESPPHLSLHPPARISHTYTFSHTYTRALSHLFLSLRHPSPPTPDHPGVWDHPAPPPPLEPRHSTHTHTHAVQASNTQNTGM